MINSTVNDWNLDPEAGCVDQWSEVPHAGFHGSLGQPKSQPYFEGWYTRVQIPAQDLGFAWMLALLDSDRNSGGLMQILGSVGGDEALWWRTLPGIQGFWAASDRLALGHWGSESSKQTFPKPTIRPQLLDPNDFFAAVSTGYQFTANLHQGIGTDPATGERVRWCYRIQPLYTYGIPPQATMGIFSYLPVFEPGWQILMAQGSASGWVEWQGERYGFEQAPTYAEKNWGSAFPGRWFWISCNTFPGWPELTLTCVGSRRGVLWWQDEVGMVALHGQGQAGFLDWKPENSQMSWQVDPWGSWQVEAQGSAGWIRLTGQTQHPGAAVMTPSPEGMIYSCRDTLRGSLRLEWWRQEGQVRVKELDLWSHSACLEVGGSSLDKGWIRS